MEATSQGNGDITEKKKGALAEVFGQFATRKFWKEVLKTLVQEAIFTFLMAFGGTVYWYGKKGKNKDVEATTGVIGGGGEATSKAFGNGYSPNPSFFSGSSSGNFPVAVSPGGDNRYPGF